MDKVSTASSPPSLHPVFWIAAISVTLLCLAGVAALAGFLPVKSAPAPQRPAIVAAAPANEPTVAAVAPAAPVATTQAAAPPASQAPAVIHHKAPKKKVEHGIPAGAAAVPPPLAGGVPPDYVPAAVAAPAPPAPCPDCGVIANVRQVSNEGKASGAGARIGGLAGAALGSNVGRGNTRTLASIAGAVGGGMLGNSIEKSQGRTTGYEVSLRMDDGRTRTIASDTMPSWRIGDRVKLIGGAIVSR